ncbi:MAG TPA: quinone-dependent dihydroorotate dehydrogenase [Burkholderiales bacterium]|jgi:dihydroorotate dehydrogenase|nr:quinone-dependent dihydroorotate dehydrogenase [Burkholderiales bacterium]
MGLNVFYPPARAALFNLEAERAHAVTMKGLSALAGLGLAGLINGRVPDDPRTVMGIRFPNPVGMAAGADKNGECIDGFGALGFGFLELGGVCPRAQPGNPKPRLFRLPAANAIINRLGFNNYGVDVLVENLKRRTYKGVIGVNLGKNLDTPLEKAADDYAICYEKIYPHCDFATVNISSPNTKNLRQLQGEDELGPILERIKREQARLADTHGRMVPVVVKIAPDLDDEQVETIARLLVKHRIDAVTATNTTISRDAVQGLANADEAGGLSGTPVYEMSNRVIRKLAQHLDGALPIIGVGGIMSGADARAKIEAGASLVQFYTGLVYRGPALVPEVARALRA